MEIDLFKNSHSSIYQKLIHRGITRFITILLLDEVELQELLNINHIEVDELKNLITTKIQPESRLGNVPDTRLSTGCEQIDAIIRGGIPTTRAIELFGSSGSGKTQFCLQLLITVQLPLGQGGLNKSAVYLCTEPPFPAKRFHELCEFAPEKFQTTKNDFENNVYVNICYNSDEFLSCLHEKLPKLMEKINVGLIIIDTIAALFRGEDKEVNYRKRNKVFSKIIELLRGLAMKNDSALLFVNQVTDNPDTNESHAALGTFWSQLVAQKLQISRKESFSSTRQFSIINSYECESTSVDFHITQQGIV